MEISKCRVRRSLRQHNQLIRLARGLEGNLIWRNDVLIGPVGIEGSVADIDRRVAWANLARNGHFR